MAWIGLPAGRCSLPPAPRTGTRVACRGRIAACRGWRSPQSGHCRRDRTRGGGLLARDQLGAAALPAALREGLISPIPAKKGHDGLVPDRQTLAVKQVRNAG